MRFKVRTDCLAERREEERDHLGRGKDIKEGAHPANDEALPNANRKEDALRAAGTEAPGQGTTTPAGGSRRGLEAAGAKSPGGCPNPAFASN